MRTSIANIRELAQCVWHLNALVGNYVEVVVSG